MTRAALTKPAPVLAWRSARHGCVHGRRAASLLLALALTACNASGLPPGGDPQLRWMDPAGRLTHLRALADSVLADVTSRVTSQLDVAGVIITVVSDGRQAIGGYGLGGRTHSATDVRLYIDADYPNLAAVLVPRLAWLAAHELHHAARWRSAGYGSTLLEAMVSEGLADRFAEELLRAPPPPWINAFSHDSTDHFLTIARREFNARGYNHAEWFFDASPTRPRWTAYTIGYRLVLAHQASHAGKTAAALVSTPAARFRP